MDISNLLANVSCFVERHQPFKFIGTMQKATLEVERKFCGLAIPLLSPNAGKPPFRRLRFLGEQNFQDVYFDRRDKLSTNGIWVRKRQMEGGEPTWEAKIRKGGTFNNSAFEELTDVTVIARSVEDITGRHEPATRNFGLEMLAVLSTRRKSWLADDRYKIVLDSMDFGHEVGEVELERRITLPEDQHRHAEVEAMKRDITRDMDRQIEAFMERYRWAFRSGIPQGKLTAYFEKQKAGSL